MPGGGGPRRRAPGPARRGAGPPRDGKGRGGAVRGVRGLGRGRRTRRELERGGQGVAGRLNDALGRWPGVVITPMFGRWGYFVGRRLFACFPLAAREHDLWLRLPLPEQRRALAQGGARPHRRFAAQGWVEMTVEAPGDLVQALGWLRRGHAAATREAPAP